MFFRGQRPQLQGSGGVVGAAGGRAGGVVVLLVMDVSVIWPVSGFLDKVCPDGIVADVVPFFGIGFIGA